MGDDSKAARAAAALYCALGWRIVAIPLRSKAPVDPDWPNRKYTPEQIVGNVGVMLGPASGHLTDVDIDSYWGLRLASFFLPETARFGRPSKENSHRIYYCVGVRTRAWIFSRNNKLERIEVRAKNASNDNGGQTVFPGSIHECGEPINWSDDSPEEITVIERGELLWAMTRLAVACIIAEEMQEGRGRNNQILGWSGGLLNAKWAADEVRELFEAVYAATEADDAQTAKDLGAVERTIEAYAQGTTLAGFGSLSRDGLVESAVIKRVEHHCRTPDTLAANLKLASASAGVHTRERIFREAQEVDKLGQIQDEIAEGMADASGDAVDSDPWTGVELSFFDSLREPEPLSYIWQCLAPGKVSGLVAYAGTAKTPFALQLGLCVARGAAFLKSPTQQRKTMYATFEGALNTRRKAQRIARGLGFTLADVADQFAIAVGPSGSLNAISVAALIAACLASAILFVIIDTWGSALDGNIDRNSVAFSDALKQMGDASDKYGITFLVLLHERKTQKVAGSALQRIDGHNSAAGALQAAIELSRPEEEDKTLIRVSCVRAPEDEFDPFEIRWKDLQEPGTAPGFGSEASQEWGLIAEPSDGKPSARVRDRQAAQHAEAAKTVRQDVVRYVQNHPLCTATQIVEGVKGNAQAIKEARCDLVASGALIETPDGQRQRYTTRLAPR